MQVEEDEAEAARQRPTSYAAATGGKRSGGPGSAAAAGSSGSRAWAGQAAAAAEQHEHDEELEAFRQGRYEPRDGWHEGMQVERGASRHRIDLKHGFVRDIVSARGVLPEETCGFWRDPSCAHNDNVVLHGGRRPARPRCRVLHWRQCCRARRAADALLPAPPCLASPARSPPQVRNQLDRDAYEKAWREAHAKGDEYQQKWGRAKVERDGRQWGT